MGRRRNVGVLWKENEGWRWEAEVKREGWGIIFALVPCLQVNINWRLKAKQTFDQLEAALDFNFYNNLFLLPCSEANESRTRRPDLLRLN